MRLIHEHDEGFVSVLQPAHFRMFSAISIGRLSCGSSSFDVDEFESSVDLGQRSTKESTTIISFFKVLREWDEEMRSKFLKIEFDGTHVPAGGFANTDREFSIDYVGDAQQLPTCHLCSNRIELPDYGDEDILRMKFTMAVLEGAASFDLP
jgi:hypothetical protein